MTYEWCISDTHFGHDKLRRGNPKIILDNPRPKNFEEIIINRWNRYVKPNDTVFHLGDVALVSSAKTIDYLSKLNGRIIIIRGNHDSIDMKNLPSNISISNLFVFIKFGVTTVMTHKPILDENFLNCFNGMSGKKTPVVVNLHGHIHENNGRPYDKKPWHVHYDIGKQKFFPVSLETMLYINGKT